LDEGIKEQSTEIGFGHGQKKRKKKGRLSLNTGGAGKRQAPRRALPFSRKKEERKGSQRANHQQKKGGGGASIAASAKWTSAGGGERGGAIGFVLRKLRKKGRERDGIDPLNLSDAEKVKNPPFRKIQ